MRVWLSTTPTHIAVWQSRGKELPTQAKSNVRLNKVLLCCFWDSKEMLYYVLHPTRAHDHCCHVRHSSFLFLQIEELGWETVPHMPYSPDISPSYYHLFRSLKAFLAKKSFAKFEELDRAVANFFDFRFLQIWENAIADLSSARTVVMTNNGGCVVD